MVAGMDKTGTQFFGGGSRLHLLLNAAALVGQFDYELCHVSYRPVR
jgi:hypothetical protein